MTHTDMKAKLCMANASFLQRGLRPLGRRLEQVTGDLTTGALWGEDRSFGGANSDHKAKFGVTSCAGGLCLP